MSETSNLVILVGSVRDGRFGPVVGAWTAEQAITHGGLRCGDHRPRRLRHPALSARRVAEVRRRRLPAPGEHGGPDRAPRRGGRLEPGLQVGSPLFTPLTWGGAMVRRQPGHSGGTVTCDGSLVPRQGQGRDWVPSLPGFRLGGPQTTASFSPT